MNTSTCPNDSKNISWDSVKELARSQSTLKQPICAHALQNLLASLSLNQLTKAFTYLVNSGLISQKHWALSLQHAKTDSLSHTTPSTNLASLPTHLVKDRIAWLAAGVKAGTMKDGRDYVELAAYQRELDRRLASCSCPTMSVPHNRDLCEQLQSTMEPQWEGKLITDARYGLETWEENQRRLHGLPTHSIKDRIWDQCKPVGKILYNNDWITWETYEMIRNEPSSSH